MSDPLRARGRRRGARPLLLTGAVALALVLGGTGCRKNLDLLYEVEEGVDLTQLAFIDVLIEDAGEGTFDVVAGEDNYSPLGVHVVSDAVAETILVSIDLTLVDPARVPGLLLRLRVPGGRPLVRFVPTLVPAKGAPLTLVAEASPPEVEYARGELVTVTIRSAGGPVDAGTGDAGSDAGGATDAGPGTDSGGGTDAGTDGGIDSGL